MRVGTVLLEHSVYGVRYYVAPLGSVGGVRARASLRCFCHIGYHRFVGDNVPSFRSQHLKPKPLNPV